ncbi:phosphonate ABC transporter substrate-binding protein [Mariprofundus sp. EBB-1]|uniref:phosphonate ABC transporter substrate-binding protein n=1 Tax=Mariprofundus sp. EBB-1 TaxID=2650971 RepID=UPI000EF27049|nr:phosphonate ABC transporter substrate-binding protein [Mariprofundus sp. EBB-1]RLL52719.1 phosphonate ABC transporter substrate-binding protein [Mariprofundus sp. EBB-1]
MNKIKLSILAASLMCLLPSQLMAKPLVLGLIPAENNEEMIRTFEPMRQYLEQKTGEKIKVYTATNYAGVIEGMRKGRVDIAWFGPLSYVLAEKEAGAEAFAVGVRKSSGKSTYRSLMVVPGDSTAHSIMDLKGKSVAFVDPASTSGGLVPTYMVKKATGMMPKQFFGKFTYAGSHDAAEMAVKNKTVDAAADNDITYPKLLKKGMITEQSNRVLVYSDPLPGSPMAYRKNLSEDLKRNIRDAILYAHYTIKPTGYGDLSKYEQAAPADYQTIRDLVKQLGLTRNDILK